MSASTFMGEYPSGPGLNRRSLCATRLRSLLMASSFRLSFAPVGPGWPCGVQVGDPQVALAASVGHVRPEAEHEARDHLVGVRRVVHPPAGVAHGASVH